MATLDLPEIIEAPQPPDTPALASLLTVSPPTDPPDSRWATGGVTWDPPGGCGTASRWAGCSGATKPATSPGAPPVFLPFNVVAGYQCSSLGAHEDPDRYARQATIALERQLSPQIEAELWTGTLAQANGWGTPFLANGDATEVAAGAQPYSFAVGALLKALRGCLGDRRGVLHMAPDVVAHLVNKGALRVVENRIETVFGDSVVSGGGYPGSGDVVNARYTITTTGSSGGTFTLTVTNPSSGATETTAAINHNANAAAVASALAALTFIDASDLTVTGGALPTATVVNFTGTLAGEDITMTGTSSLNAGTLAVTETIAGGSQPDSEPRVSTIYATGPLVTRVGPVDIYPTQLADADWRTNTITVFAERTVLAGFDTCCHFSVQADLTDPGGDDLDIDGETP